MARRLTLSGANSKDRHVGAEYFAQLSGGERPMEQKRVDAWVTVAPKTHFYVELKVAFNNDKLATQLARWREDAVALKRVDHVYEEAFGAAAILVGVDLPKVGNHAGIEITPEPRVALWATKIPFKRGGSTSSRS